MTLLPLIPLLPLLGFLFNFLYGTRLSRPAHGQGGHGHGQAWEHSPLIGWVACGSMLLSFLCAVGAVLGAQAAPGGALQVTLWSWIPGGAADTAAGASAFGVDWAYLLDPLSSVMALVVTLVGLLIHVNSIGYMGHDPGYPRFMAYMNLFAFAMLTLVLGANFSAVYS